MTNQFANEQCRKLTRTEVAARLRISTSSVRRLEGVHLHPVQDERGVWLFDSAELEAVPHTRRRRSLRSRGRRATAGEIAARIFRMFESGRDLTDVVTTTRQPPALVRQLYREWRTPLETGERDRKDRERSQQVLAARERERRERADEERMHLEWMKSLTR